MADDRLKQLAFRWGLVGFGMQLFDLRYVFLDQAHTDVDLFFTEDLDKVMLRFGQLKPPIFKFPGAGWLVWLYVMALVLCLLAVWWLALRNLFRTPEQ